MRTRHSELREIFEMRISSDQRKEIVRLAEQETEGNLSEAARRLLDYGIAHMPRESLRPTYMLGRSKPR